MVLNFQWYIQIPLVWNKHRNKHSQRKIRRTDDLKWPEEGLTKNNPNRVKVEKWSIKIPQQVIFDGK